MGLYWGALVGVPVFLFLLGLDALGNCTPGSGCRHGFWLMVALPSLTVTALGRRLINAEPQAH